MLAPETVTCVYCGSETHSYQLVSQIPTSFCAQSFVLEELRARNGEHLKPNDFICFEHEETFRIKQLCKKRNKPFSASFSYNFSVTQQEEKCCAKCLSKTSIRYFSVNQMTEDLKNFLINKITIDSQGKVTRKGSGIGETSLFCRACYYQLRRKKSDITFTPRKRRLISNGKEEEPNSSTESQKEDELLCVWCGKGRSKKGAKLVPITDTLNTHLQNVSQFSKDFPATLNVYRKHIHKGGSKAQNCRLSLLNESSKCKKEISDQEIADDQEVAHEQDITDHLDEDFVIEENGLVSDFTEFFEEIVEERLSDGLPVHLPTVFNRMNEELKIGRRSFDHVVQVSLRNNPHRKLHIANRKIGRLMYNDQTDFILKTYELSKKTDASNDEPSDMFKISMPANTLATELFHVMKEMRDHVQAASKLCEVYATYPEMLQSINLEQLLFTGVHIKVGNIECEVPTVDPLIFNFLYFITCSDEEARVFEKTFSPTCDTIYQEGYKKESKIVYSRVLSTMFDILHQRNKDNIYPFQILFSDMIVNINPTRLMEYFSRLRKCASPRKYDEYKVTTASHVKKIKESGKILGLLGDMFVALHMDNLEQYQKHARNPAKALISSLVIAAQQPLPSSYEMKLRRGIDIRKLHEDNDTENDFGEYLHEYIHEKNGLDTIIEERIDDICSIEEERDECDELVENEEGKGAEYPDKQNKEDETENGEEKDGEKWSAEENDDKENEENTSETEVARNNSSTECTEDVEKEEWLNESIEVELNENSDVGMENNICSDTNDQENVVEDKLADYDSDSTAFSQSTETTESSVALVEDYELPLTRSSKISQTSSERTQGPSFDFQPRYKRIRLDFGVEHSDIPKYSVPSETIAELRQSKENHFIETIEEEILIEKLNYRILTHAILQMKGQHIEEDIVKQLVPSFKETLAWGEPVTEKSNTAYLELIPGPPDNMDTLLYALSLVKELFIEKLGHIHVVVCGDGKTVNILYKIKDEYGSQMSWLVIMLGSWHLLKTYLEVFFKKYDSAFCRHLLTKMMTQGNVDAVLSAKNWAKSHNYLIWIMSAVLRENIDAFRKHHANGNFKDLDSHVSAAIAILKSVGEDSIKFCDTVNFCSKQTLANVALSQHRIAYKTFMATGYSADDQFALFTNALEDFLTYMTVYVSIRTGDWALRVAGIKRMAKVFVRSGATYYQWLVIRHLADISDPNSFPIEILNRLKQGAWVSALKDSRGATLARDEYHERTASLQIQLRVPKQITDQNMQVLTQYATYGAATRNNLLEQIFRKNDQFGFELSKGCGKRWINEQEASINIFRSMLQPEKLFCIENRVLKQPFTDTPAKPSIIKDFLGRDALGEIRKDYGKEVLLSYVLPRFCNKKHVVRSEKMPMKKKTLSLFPKDKRKKLSREKTVRKEKEDMIEVLAAGIVQLSSKLSKKEKFQMTGCQISDTPGLFAENMHQPNRKKDKTGLRKVLEKRYEDAFIPPTISRDDTGAIIRDGMQDLFLSPLKHHITFLDYYQLFIEVKIKPSFSVSDVVVIDFDNQIREGLVPKDNLRLDRDNVPAKSCADVDVNDESIIPPKATWISFLSNRTNKLRLVEYITSKLKKDDTYLKTWQRMIVSVNGKVFQCSLEDSFELKTLSNNHLECDTRAFYILSQLLDSKPNWVIRSTDTDFLFTSLLNSGDLLDGNKTIYLNYNTVGQSMKYCCINKLVDQIKEDPQFAILRSRNVSSPTILGLLHFVSGCDDLSFLRGFSKNFCFKVFERFSDQICPDNSADIEKVISGDDEITTRFVVRFLAYLYGHKFSSSFEQGEISSIVVDNESAEILNIIRKKTWHKTISSNSTMPSMTAVNFHTKRLIYIINSFGNATHAYLKVISPLEHGWKLHEVDGKIHIIPRWDSDENQNEMNLIRQSFLKKCSCLKGCKSKRCSCLKEASMCSNLCTCVGCENRGKEITDESVKENDDEEEEDSEDEDVENDHDEELDMKNDEESEDDESDENFNTV